MNVRDLQEAQEQRRLDTTEEFLRRGGDSKRAVEARRKVAEQAVKDRQKKEFDEAVQAELAGKAPASKPADEPEAQKETEAEAELRQWKTRALLAESKVEADEATTSEDETDESQENE